MMKGVNYSALILQMQKGHIWFVARLAESPLRALWSQHLKLLVSEILPNLKEPLREGEGATLFSDEWVSPAVGELKVLY